MALKLLKTTLCFDGLIQRFSHHSDVLKCAMNFTVFSPPAERGAGKPTPVLYWLSGLTCTDENFIIKAGALQHAAKSGLAIVCPDTSPRGVGLPGENDSWDFGAGAGFYLNATRSPWASHYRMYDYVMEELPSLLRKASSSASQAKPTLSLDVDRASISGHSMGGHGALICALKNPKRFASVSAFSPICNPINCPWGLKAFTGYLGENKEDWKQWDATELLKVYKGPDLHLLVDQGTEDEFYKQEQLLPKNLMAVCQQRGIPLEIHFRTGYDHSYFFVSTFIKDHISHHAKHLRETSAQK